MSRPSGYVAFGALITIIATNFGALTALLNRRTSPAVDGRPIPAARFIRSFQNSAAACPAAPRPERAPPASAPTSSVAADASCIAAPVQGPRPQTVSIVLAPTWLGDGPNVAHELAAIRGLTVACRVQLIQCLAIIAGAKMMKFQGLLAAGLLFFAAPAFADEYLAVTPTGAAEMLFAEKSPATIGKLTSKCIDASWTVVSSSATELVCEAPMNFGQSLLGQLAMGNSYSTPPRRFFRFNIAEINGVSRVQASGWMELQMAFGQMKRTDFSGPEFQNNILGFMFAAGGQYPTGTTFPNHAALGVEADDVPRGKQLAFRIKSIAPDSAASKAGLQLGDMVTRIAGKRFKSMGDYLDATAKAADTPTYDVEVDRGGKMMNVSVERAFRPAVTASVVATTDTALLATAAPVAAMSIADEIAKLVKLKEQGVLTEAEFQAQKQKLLQ